MSCFNGPVFSTVLLYMQCVWCVVKGKSQRLKQARVEVQEEIGAYKQQCEDECKKQEDEACN